jgi:peptide/nickel transport system substrate-binding protein
VVPAPELYASTANDACLDAGHRRAPTRCWTRPAIVDTDGDGVRETPTACRCRVLYQTSTNAVRQDFQALIKQWWSEIGIETELRNIDASVFFGGDPAARTPSRSSMPTSRCTPTTSTAPTRRPTWATGCATRPRPETQWQGANIRASACRGVRRAGRRDGQTADLAERGRSGREMNDMLVQSYSIIPLIHRGGVSAHANELEGVKMSDWDSELWNIAEWTRTPGMDASDRVA